MLAVPSVLAEFESSLINTHTGKARGVKMGRKPKLTATRCARPTTSVMQRIIERLIWIALLALPGSASAKPDEVPHFDVARSCQEARAYTGDDKNLAYRGCMKDENDARAELAQKWAHFKPGDRKDCVAQGAAPVPSYVELLTCLEMSEEAEALYKPDGTVRDKPQGAVQGKSGQDQAAPSRDTPAPESGGGKKPE
ncbi:MAG TPA: hypothetical protein VIH87_06960 [Methylocella sp.]